MKTRRNNYLIFPLAFCLLVATAGVSAADAATALMLQQRWDHVMFEVDKKQQEAQLQQLAVEADRLVATGPGNTNADVLIWTGIIHSTYAGAKGGLGALSEVKQARVLFEKAISIDATALQGAAYTSLGSLYYQVPGWPVGFGDDDKARQLLLQGLQADPDGIDANYFYGDYLLQDKKYSDAIVYLERAMAAAPRPGREIADAGRRQQISAALKTARSKLAP